MPELPVFAVRSEHINEANQPSEQQFLPLHDVLIPELLDNSLESLSAEEVAKVRATFHLMQDLAYKGWKANLSQNGDSKIKVSLQAPDEPPSKDAIRQLMEPRRLELIRESSDWIKRVEPKVIKYLADGDQINPANIEPVFEICETKHQRDMFRYCRYLSSVPYSEYVGRRMRFLIRDNSLPNRPIIGITAIGSSLLQISSRDKWIGWNGRKKRDIKKERIGSLMDLYVALSLPPYSYLLGGKLVCYMMASNWIREAFRVKYEGHPSLAKKRIIKDLVMLVTTSVYGKHSSQYNRIYFNKDLVYILLGETKGFGTLHIGEDSFAALQNVLTQNNYKHSNKFGDGANWRLRVIRDGMNLLGFDADECLNHGHPRGVYGVPFARNAKDYLRGKTDEIDYFDRSLDQMIDYWRTRWLNMRVQNEEVMEQVRNFRADSLHLTKLLNNITES